MFGVVFALVGCVFAYVVGVVYVAVFVLWF